MNKVDFVDSDWVVEKLGNCKAMHRNLPNSIAETLLKSASAPVLAKGNFTSYPLIKLKMMTVIPLIPSRRKQKMVLGETGLRVLKEWAKRKDFKKFYDCYVPHDIEDIVKSNAVEARLKTGFWADDWR